MAAPVVVAKGVDELALRIRAVAGEHNVPIVENRPLARALYASAEIDRPIPVEHYAAVAEVIGYVLAAGAGRLKLTPEIPGRRAGRPLLRPIREEMVSLSKFLGAFACSLAVLCAAPAAAAPTTRIKDVVDVENVRSNQLVGYGLVVGLAGTGDRVRNIALHRGDAARHAGAHGRQCPRLAHADADAERRRRLGDGARCRPSRARVRRSTCRSPRLATPPAFRAAR